MISLIKNMVDANERRLKKYYKLVEKINEIEPEFEKLSDQELQQKTIWFKQQLQNGKTIDDIKVEAFATVREAAKRILGMRHYDVQLIGGLVLTEGNIAEMATGEGKTLVASLPSYLRALEGKGVHVITVNEYLAKRDREIIGPIHEFLGLTVGLNLPLMEQSEKNRPILPISLTASEQNLVLTICVTIWLPGLKIESNALIILPLSTKWTVY